VRSNVEIGGKGLGQCLRRISGFLPKVVQFGVRLFDKRKEPVIPEKFTYATKAGLDNFRGLG